MNSEEFEGKYNTYIKAKKTDFELALKLNYELYEDIIMGSLEEQNLDVDNIEEFNISKKALGEYLLTLCNEAEVFRLNIQINCQEEK